MPCWMEFKSYDGLKATINTMSFQNEKASFRKAELKLQASLDITDNSLVKWTSTATETLLDAQQFKTLLKACAIKVGAVAKVSSATTNSGPNIT